MDAVTRKAPPTPCIARAKFSSSEFVAKPQAADATAKMAKPMSIDFLRPRRSAYPPDASSSEA